MKAISIIMIYFLVSSFCLKAETSLTKQEQQKLSKKELKIQREKQREEDVAKLISNKNITIIINRIYPLSSPARETSDGYNIKLIKDTLSCYLPYFGVSRSASAATIMGKGLAIEANKQKVYNIIEDTTPKKNSTLINFKFKNDNNNELWTCTIEIFSNGNANIRFDGNSRDAISYQGELSETTK